MSDDQRPIIIKRKKVIAGGHHGGAWKVAYADFVTAMMAFFLLMWLLGATTEKQRKGIADYFNPTIPVNKVSGGGSGAFGGDSVFSENTLAKNGTGAGVPVRPAKEEADGDKGSSPEEGEDSAAEGSGADELKKLEEMLSALAGESMVSELLSRHVITRLTDEGLIVEIFDVQDAPLFEDENTPTRTLEEVIVAIAEVFRLARNEIAVNGHMAATPLAARADPVWERSAARADAVRLLLIEAGIAAQRVQRVSGFADRKPVTRDPLSIRNNRIELILLRHAV